MRSFYHGVKCSHAGLRHGLSDQRLTTVFKGGVRPRCMYASATKREVDRPVRAIFRTTLCGLKLRGLYCPAVNRSNHASCGFIRVLGHFSVVASFGAGGSAGELCSTIMDPRVGGFVFSLCGLLRLRSCHDLPDHCHCFCLRLSGVICLVGCGAAGGRTPFCILAISRLTGGLNVRVTRPGSQGGGITSVLGGVGACLGCAGFGFSFIGNSRRE